MKLNVFAAFLVMLFAGGLLAGQVLVEAESFDDKGGWVVDPQFTEAMGSPYLLAHGLGKTVQNAKTEITFPQQGKYYVWVRTQNWVPGNWKAPGRFQIVVDGKTLPTIFGTETGWTWQSGGSVEIGSEKVTVELKDLTGFDGRCDAIYFTTNAGDIPPNESKAMRSWRDKLLAVRPIPVSAGKFDVVIVGGGIAGCAAALAAEEQGLKVAIIHDRPIFGGNASSEVRVHTIGIHGKSERILKKLDTGHWPNSSAKSKIDDKKRQTSIDKAKGVAQFKQWRAYAANTKGNKILSVDARHIESGQCKRFFAPVFIDCTGDGWVGYWAGAEYEYGRESKHTYGEENEKGKFRHRGQDTVSQNPDLWSPEKSDALTMGTSVMFTTERVMRKTDFPEVPWAMDVAKDLAATSSEWYWEFANADLHQVDDAEAIRDHMLRAIYGSFANAKKNPKNKKVALKWVGFICGKRESRRLVGDYVYTMKDAVNGTQFADSVVEEVREIDVHFQQKLTGSKYDFRSEALFVAVPRYYIPFRSLYSKNIENLMMAGRCFSCSHIGLGGPRVMLTTGQMGVATGYAASLCVKHKTPPRGVYEQHIDQLRKLIGYY